MISQKIKEIEGEIEKLKREMVIANKFHHETPVVQFNYKVKVEEAKLQAFKEASEMIENYDLKIKSLRGVGYSWKDIKCEIIKSFEECKTEEDLLREIGRIIKSTNIKEELKSSIIGSEEKK